MATLVGVVYDPKTGEPYQVIVPDDNRELDDPAFTQHGRYTMLRVPISVFHNAGDRFAGVQACIALIPKLKADEP